MDFDIERIIMELDTNYQQGFMNAHPPHPPTPTPHLLSLSKWAGEMKISHWLTQSVLEPIQVERQ